MHRLLGILLIAVSAVLLFWRLDGAPLWRDEGTTANWGRLMAERDRWIPYVYDFEERQLIVQAADGHDINSRLLPAMQSYLQFYVAGLSFELLGVSEWTARLPFALLGALALWLLYRLGLTLFGPGVLALAPPAYAALSIFFLQAARQCRYYVIVVLAATWLLLEFCRYLREPQQARRLGFYVRLGLGGLLLYAGNYASFVGMWAALGIFTLAHRDWRLFRGFAALSAVLAVPIAGDFFALHAEFVSSWPPPAEESVWESYQRALAGRGSDLWRALPFVFIVPAGLALARAAGAHISGRAAALGVVALVVVLGPLGLFDVRTAVDASPAAFWLGVLVALALPAAFLLLYRRLPSRGLWVEAALLAALVLIVGPAITIVAGKTGAYLRHFYQVMPAGALLASLALAGVARYAGPAAAVAFFAVSAFWPNLETGIGGTEYVVPRQYVRDRSYEQPMIDALASRIQPGDEVAFVRNVKGMTAYFYLPQMRWVCLLDSSAPHNQQFRGRIPDDQFDDYRGADWYVIWDPRDEVALGLTDEFELVWERSYSSWTSWWDRAEPGSVRTYRLYGRRPSPVEREVPAESP